MDLVDDLPRPQHQASQSAAQAAALIGQLGDVVARRHDRADQPGRPAVVALNLAQPDDSLVFLPSSLDVPDPDRAAAHEQLRQEALSDAAEQASAPGNETKANDDVSADLGAADTQTTLSTDLRAEARHAANMAAAAFPKAADVRAATPMTWPSRPAVPIAQPQVVRGR